LQRKLSGKKKQTPKIAAADILPDAAQFLGPELEDKQHQKMNVREGPIWRGSYSLLCLGLGGSRSSLP